MRLHHLIRLYPRAWRERYGAELTSLLETAAITWRIRVDLIRGAASEWAYEASHPRRWTPGRRMAWRTGARGLVALTFAMTVLMVGRAVAPLLTGIPLPWPVWVAAGALYFGFVGRAIHAQIKAGLLNAAAYTNPRILRATVSYPEFGLWIGAAFVVATLAAIDTHLTWMSTFGAVWTWCLWFDWMHSATPAQIRYVRAERRLMQRSGVMSAAITRYERKRTENAERLMRFYGRVPPVPAPFVRSAAGTDRS